MNCIHYFDKSTLAPLEVSNVVAKKQEASYHWKEIITSSSPTRFMSERGL
jgi:hypothetical protein